MYIISHPPPQANIYIHPTATPSTGSIQTLPAHFSHMTPRPLALRQKAPNQHSRIRIIRYALLAKASVVWIMKSLACVYIYIEKQTPQGHKTHMKTCMKDSHRQALYIHDQSKQHGTRRTYMQAHTACMNKCIKTYFTRPPRIQSMTLEEAETLGLSVLKQVMEEKVRAGTTASL